MKRHQKLLLKVELRAMTRRVAKEEVRHVIYKKYSFLCVIGAIIFYILCLPYSYLLSAKGKELHDALFALIPWFVWGNLLSMAWGGVFVGVLAGVAGWYISWMHNVSMISGLK